MVTVKNFAAFVCLCLIWGTSWIASSVLTGVVPPFRVAALRYGSAAVLLFGVALVRRSPVRSTSLPSAVLGISMIAAPYLLLDWSGARISAGTTALVFSAVPLAAAAFSVWLRAGLVPRRGLYVALAGVGAMS